MYFAPGLRDDHRGSPLPGRDADIRRPVCRPVRQAARHDRSHLVEPLKRVGKSLPPQFDSGFPILLDACALVGVTTKCRVLPTNRVQLHRPHAGMTLDGEQARQKPQPVHAAACRRKERRGHSVVERAHQFEHLPSADLARLVHTMTARSGSSRLVRNSPPLPVDGKPAFSISTTCCRCGARTTTGSADCLELSDQFVQDETLAGARAAAKDETRDLSSPE
jgi:hypothetical protein